MSAVVTMTTDFGLSDACVEGEGFLTLFGSSGHLELSFKDGSARDFLGADVGDEVRIRLPETGYD
jgi:S-adenosylmethionine hydrolase